MRVFFSHVNRYIRCVQIRVLQEHELLQQVKLIARTPTHTHTRCQSRFHLDGLHPLINSDGLWNSELSVWKPTTFHSLSGLHVWSGVPEHTTGVGGGGRTAHYSWQRSTCLTCVILIVPDGTGSSSDLLPAGPAASSMLCPHLVLASSPIAQVLTCPLRY